MSKTIVKKFDEVVEVDGIEGRVELRVSDFEAGDPKYKVTFEGEEFQLGSLLYEMREDFGGQDEGDLLNPYTDELYRLSLKPWQDCDPEKTFISIEWGVIYIEDVYPGDPCYGNYQPKRLVESK